MKNPGIRFRQVKEGLTRLRVKEPHVAPEPQVEHPWFSAYCCCFVVIIKTQHCPLVAQRSNSIVFKPSSDERGPNSRCSFLDVFIPAERRWNTLFVKSVVCWKRPITYLLLTFLQSPRPLLTHTSLSQIKCVCVCEASLDVEWLQQKHVCWFLWFSLKRV